MIPTYSSSYYSSFRRLGATLLVAFLAEAHFSGVAAADEFMKSGHDKITGSAPVNGLKMYYEIEGTGAPLVYIPPVFGFAGIKTFPALVQNHAVITMDLQGYGRTADIPERPLTLEQCAEDVMALLKYLRIAKADFFGESYGGAIVTLIAVHHPDVVKRVVTYGATFGPPQVAHNPAMLHVDRAPTPDSPSHRYQMERYKEVAPDPNYWPKLWGKVIGIRWEGFSNEQLTSIRAPFLIVLGDRDFVRVEHATETSKRIPHAELAVIPDAGHFALFSDPERVIPIVKHFLEKPAERIPVATAGMGYRPGETR
jgi:pimeloyl-ACP methyl ester carboxylesterase